MRILFFFLFLLFISCNKDDSQSNLKTLLTQSTWTTFEEYAADQGTTDFDKFSPSCQDDNPWVFYENGTYLLTEGVELCGSFPIEFNGTYVLDEPERTMVLDPDLSDEIWDILTLTEDSLVIETSMLSASSTNRIVLTR